MALTGRFFPGKGNLVLRFSVPPVAGTRPGAKLPRPVETVLVKNQIQSARTILIHEKHFFPEAIRLPPCPEAWVNSTPGHAGDSSRHQDQRHLRLPL